MTTRIVALGFTVTTVADEERLAPVQGPLYLRSLCSSEMRSRIDVIRLRFSKSTWFSQLTSLDLFGCLNPKSEGFNTV